MDILKKFLPEKLKKLLQDKTVVNDMVILTAEMEKAVEAAAQNPATKKNLKDAFNDAATVLSAAQTYLERGKLSIIQSAKFAAGKGRLKASFQTLSDGFKAKDPAIVACGESLKDNETFNAALKRISLKTNGELFRLELGENGQAYAVELISGKSIKFALDKEDYEEITKALGITKTPPNPPKGPSA